MRLRLRSFRRLVVVALPCWMLGGPLAATLQSVAACPHDAMPSSMHHGQGTEAPCWCPDMAGAGTIELPTLPASTAEPAVTVTVAPTVTRVKHPESVALPPSPLFAPTPPPPNSFS